MVVSKEGGRSRKQAGSGKVQPEVELEKESRAPFPAIEVVSNAQPIHQTTNETN